MKGHSSTRYLNLDRNLSLGMSAQAPSNCLLCGVMHLHLSATLPAGVMHLHWSAILPAGDPDRFCCLGFNKVKSGMLDTIWKGRPSVRVDAKKAKPQSSKRRKKSETLGPVQEWKEDEEFEYEDELPPANTKGREIPTKIFDIACATRDKIHGGCLEPHIKYKVFAPPAGSVEKPGGEVWSWGENAPSGSNEAPVPEWNPKSGFMRTESDLDDDDSSSSAGWAGEAGAAPYSEPVSLFAPAETEDGGALPSVSKGQVGEGWWEGADVSLFSPAETEDRGALPSVSKGQVLSSCVSTTGWMLLIGFFLRLYAETNATEVLGTDPQVLAEFLQINGIESWSNVGIVLGAVLTVTGARVALMKVWPEFRIATNRSNQQILQPLGWIDIIVIASLTGISEEFLFRGAIIPASFPDWRGVVLSGVIFGALHNSGGRNIAFAAWASAIGCFYGGLFLFTHNLWVPAAAHSLSNFASAALWKSRATDEPTSS
eukprot:gene8083-1325_t